MSTLTHDASVETTERTQDVDPGGHDRFAHYVKKSKVDSAYLNQEAVVALCGKVWVPRHNPHVLPKCPTCVEIYESIKSGENDE